MSFFLVSSTILRSTPPLIHFISLTVVQPFMRAATTDVVHLLILADCFYVTFTMCAMTTFLRSSARPTQTRLHREFHWVGQFYSHLKTHIFHTISHFTTWTIEKYRKCLLTTWNCIGCARISWVTWNSFAFFSAGIFMVETEADCCSVERIVYRWKSSINTLRFVLTFEMRMKGWCLY